MSLVERWTLSGTWKRMTMLLAVGAALMLVLAACEADDVEPDVADDPDDEVTPDDDDVAETDWFPEREVTMVVPFAAGGGSDLLGRAMVGGMEEIEPDIDFAVEVRDGGSGAVGYGHLFEQSGDPHFLLPSEVTRSNLPFAQDVPFDYDSWTDIVMLGEDMGYLVVSDDSEWETIEEFMESAEEASEAGQPLRVGLPGAAGVDEVTVFQLGQEGGFDFERTIYDGTGETNPALLAGDIDATVVNPSDGRSELEAGEFRAILGFGAERLDDEILGDVPVAPEMGWDITGTKYRGMIAAPDIPDEARDFWIGLGQQIPETDTWQEYMEEAMLAENVLIGEEWVQWLEDSWHPAVLPDLEAMLED